MNMVLTHGLDEIMTLLEVENLTIDYGTDASPQLAIEDVSLSLRRGDTMGIIGESGCGKSTLALSILGLLPEIGRQIGGRVLFNGIPWLDQPSMSYGECAGRIIIRTAKRNECTRSCADTIRAVQSDGTGAWLSGKPATAS